MSTPMTDPYTEACERHFAEGLARGRVEGEALGKAKALLAFLAARGLLVNEAIRERVLSCTDHGLLDRWIVRAAVVETAADVVR